MTSLPPKRERPECWSAFRARVSHPGFVPFFWLEWIWEWTAYALGRWVFLEVLEYIGQFSVLVAIVFYIVEAPDRTKQKLYSAWQVVNTAQGKGGSGGRIEALEDLNQEKVPLIGVNVENAFLAGVRLEHADLMRANFSAADARNSHFTGSSFDHALLRSANFREADLRGVQFNDANLRDVDFTGSNLSGANFADADLSTADLRRADLTNLRWDKIANIKLANIYNVQNAPAGFTDWALKHGAVSLESTEAWTKLTGD